MVSDHTANDTRRVCETVARPMDEPSSVGTGTSVPHPVVEMCHEDIPRDSCEGIKEADSEINDSSHLTRYNSRTRSKMSDLVIEHVRRIAAT